MTNSIALLLLLAPAALSAQVRTLSYRGFTPGQAFREFTVRARELAHADALLCRTSTRTAKLMECGVRIRDPRDSASFYLSAYVIENRVAMLAFTDSGAAALVTRTQRDLTRRFGQARAAKAGMWEWRWGGGEAVGRLTWKGVGARRWISLTLWHPKTMDQIGSYVPATARRP